MEFQELATGDEIFRVIDQHLRKKWIPGEELF
jgi:hypothetical protein